MSCQCGATRSSIRLTLGAHDSATIRSPRKRSTGAEGSSQRANGCKVTPRRYLYRMNVSLSPSNVIGTTIVCFGAAAARRMQAGRADCLVWLRRGSVARSNQPTRLRPCSTWSAVRATSVRMRICIPDWHLRDHTIRKTVPERTCRR